MTPQQLQALRDSLPLFTDRVAPSPQLLDFCRYYAIDFAGQQPRLEYIAGAVPSGCHGLAAHLWLQPGATSNLLLLHGYLDHTGLFGNLISYGLARRCNVLIFDLPGHGLSSGEPAVIDDFSDYSSAIVDVLAAARMPQLPLWVMAQSTGCAALVDYASKHSWPFAAAVLLAPLVRPTGWLGVRVGHMLLQRFVDSVPRKFNENSSDLKFLEFVQSDPLQSARVSLRWVGALRRWLDALPDRDLGVGPALVVQGDDDKTVAWRYNLKVISQLFPGSQMEYLPGAGHQLANESAEIYQRYLATVDTWLAARVPREETDDTGAALRDPRGSAGQELADAAVLSQVDDSVLSALQDIVGPGRVLTDDDSRQLYGRDWTRVYSPCPSAVVLPGSIEEVQEIVRLAARLRLAIVPSGGRTGLSAGAVACSGELVLALDRLNYIRGFDPVDRSVCCGAGVITRQLQHYAMARDLFYPVDFAASGSSQVGGNISSNAGGIKVIRYGSTRDWVAGLKIVTGSGELLDLNRGLVKNNAGYDLRHLVIGAEGTLGIVVEATMRLCQPPHNLAVMVLGVPDMAAIMSVLATFQGPMELSAFEFFSELALQKVIQHQGLQRPFDTPANYYALLEFEQPGDVAMQQALTLFEHCVAQAWVLDGVVSQSIAQAESLWRLREDISETISRWTPYKNDISALVSRVPDLLTEVEAVVNANYPEFEMVWFGHIGDGNVHLNILKPDDLPMDQFQQRCDEVSKWVFEIVQRYGGSIAAEHGVGLLKRDYLQYSCSEVEIAIMRQIKAAFDPFGIMNPGKVFDV